MTEQGAAAFHCLSDRGLVRAENQDAWHADGAEGLFLVADGMGGQNAGAVAAAAAAGVLPGMILERLSTLDTGSAPAVKDALVEVIGGFSAMLREQAARDGRLRGMGSTLVLALARRGGLHVAHLGDSRAYLFAGGKLRLLTEDHSLAALLLKLKQITPEEAAVHPGRSRLTRYLGMDGRAEAVVKGLRQRGARLLLCTDGLTGMVPDDRIRDILAERQNPEAACRSLVDESLAAGGTDNVTVMVIDLPEAAARAGGARSRGAA